MYVCVTLTCTVDHRGREGGGGGGGAVLHIPVGVLLQELCHAEHKEYRKQRKCIFTMAV